MEEVVGAVSTPKLLTEPPYLDCREAIGEQKWRILGAIARTDPAKVGLLDVLDAPALENCWRRELDYWERIIDEDEMTPQPIARAAIRRLRRDPPPPPPRLSVVHGDYRTGNFLFDDTGRIHAILDWEMCHLGDPLEDLAWALDPLWSWPDRERPGKLLPRERALALWEESSGMTIDRGRARLVGDLRFGEGTGDLDLVGSRVRRRSQRRSDPRARQLVSDRRPRSRARRAPGARGGPIMKPEVDVVLRSMMTKLLMEVAPAVGDAYVRSNVEAMVALLAAAAEEFDRAAEVRVEENRSMRSDPARRGGAAFPTRICALD